MNYYNEFDPKAAAWLRELIAAGELPPGDVDECSILEIKSDGLAAYTQCHFFAGIGGWSLALRLANWPVTRPVWTGSCPCQPFSAAGKQRGVEDERHLWPVFHKLIAECHPPAVFGEQVASKLGREWLAGVRTDLEGVGYALGAADLCAAGVGAPHIRQRLFWVAHSTNPDRWSGIGGEKTGVGARELGRRRSAGGGSSGGMADVQQQGLEGHAGNGNHGNESGRIGEKASGSTSARSLTGGTIGTSGLGDANSVQSEQPARNGAGSNEAQSGRPCGEPAGSSAFVRLGDTQRGGVGGGDQPGPDTQGRQMGERKDGESPSNEFGDGRENVGFWSNAILIPCRDGKARRIEPTIRALVDGVPGRVGLLRGAGNAIVPQIAKEFIRAFIETEAAHV